MNTTDAILQVEKKYDLNSISIRGFNVWMYHRFIIYEQISKKLGFIPAGKKEGKINGILRNCINATKMLFRKNNPPIKNVDILFLSHPRRIRTSKKYECIYTDELAQLYPNSVTLERLYNNEGHFAPAKTENIFYVDRMVLKSFWKGFTAKYFYSIKYQELKKEIRMSFGKPLEELSASVGVDLNISSIIEHMTQRYFFYSSRLKDYEKLLALVAPKVIVETVYYSMDSMIINEIAKQMRIVSVELQHGTIGMSHIAYNFHSEYPIDSFPQKVFTFSEYWNNARYPIAKDDIISVGYPYFEQQINYYINQCNSTNEQKIILFLSSMQNTLVDFALCAAEDLCKDGWEIVYKLHPKEYDDWTELYPHLNNSSIDVIGRQTPLYELFSQCQIQIGVCSTTIYEGLGFNLKTCIYNTQGSEKMNDLCELGYAKKINDVEDLRQVIYDDNYDDASIKENLWKSNALKNMTTEIDKLITEHIQDESIRGC